jgi:peptidoglycan/xylan/chitin deacetylase (PgdA/CDA1 family)
MAKPWHGIPVIAYHEFDGPAEFSGGPRYDVHGLNIRIETFRKQLQLMYDKGFWPVNLTAVIRRQARVPEGKAPIVLTFDDGRPSQFRYLSGGKIDPKCAIGTLIDFHRAHPDWPLRGDFYLIAGSDRNGVPFDQEGSERAKVRWLAAQGFEIGNHTLTHPSFRFLSGSKIVHELAGCDRYLKSLAPKLRVETFALPYGQPPRDGSLWPLLRNGREGRSAYHNIGVALFGGGVCPEPGDPNFNPWAIPRIAPSPGLVEKILSSRGNERIESEPANPTGREGRQFNQVQLTAEQSRAFPSVRVSLHQ